VVRGRWAVGAFVGFTAFVWVQRLVNLARGDETDTTTSIVLSVTLLALAVASAVGLLVVWRQGWVVSRVVAIVWRVAASVTVVVWVVRAVQITVAWRSVGFVVVHLVLAVVSVALAVATWRAAGRSVWPGAGRHERSGARAGVGAVSPAGRGRH
jgi:hypothetical protein